MNSPIRVGQAPSVTLANVTKGRIDAPIRIVVAGVPGVGKTTFAAGAPSPIFLGAEDGTNNLDVARFPMPRGWGDVLGGVRALRQEKHDYKTLVIDTLDSIEPLCWDEVVAGDKKWTSIEDVGGGYGKGYTAAVDQWRVLMSELEQLRAAGMHVVLLAHCIVKTFKNPIGPDYDRYQMKLHEKAGALFCERADAHVFAMFEQNFEPTERDKKRFRATTDQTRVLHTTRANGYEAKNRYGLPDTLPLSWEDFYAAVMAHRPADPDVLRAAIEEAIPRLPEADRQRATDALKVVGKDALKLAELRERINAKVQIAAPTEAQKAAV